MVGLAQNLSFILLGEDRSASKTMDQAAATAEKTTGRIGGAFQRVGGIIGGEFGSILTEVGTKTEEMGGKAAKLATGLEVGGGIATAAGLGLLQFGSSAQQATDQLHTAVSDAGDAISDYSDDIEKTVKKQENLDHSAVDTKQALAVLTEASGSTKTALGQMGVVSDLAAAKHISLSDSAKLVAKVLGGSGARTLAQYGVTMQKVADPATVLASAQKNVQTSTDALAGAQKRLSDLEEIDHGKKKLSISDHIALQNAQDKVTTASGKLSDAEKKLQDAQSNTKTKTDAAKEALDQLAKKLHGQGEASVSNFGKQVDIVKTKVGDWVEEVSGPLGTAMTIAGPLVTGVGVALDLYRTKQEAATLATIAQAAAADTAAVSTTGEAVAMTGLDTAMDANPIGVVAAGLGILAGIAGGIALVSTQNLTQGEGELKGALDATNGAIDKNVQKTTAKALADNGAISAANTLGISAKTVLDATLGNADAQRQLTDQLDAQKQKANELLLSHAATAAQQAENTKTAESMGHAIDTLRGTYQNLSGTAAGEIQNLKDEAQALTGIKNAGEGANTQLDKLNGKHVHAIVDYTISTTHVTSDIPGPKKAGGGDVHTGGYTLVGEQGPEIVALPGGSHVFPSGSGPAAGGGGININITPPAGAFVGSAHDMGKSLATYLIQALRGGGVSQTELRAALGVVQ